MFPNSLMSLSETIWFIVSSLSSVDDGDGLDLDDPLRTPGSVFRLIVYDIRGDLHDVGIARAGGGKRQSDIAHRLRCLRGQVSRTDQRTASINGHLAAV